ncbi:hypothetical protein N0V90_010582 [Kalmusia sp. IMI 367209]|nr:hypothetical protein N0V90_010582 [Kalmusia sp. IMI 367209]
MPPFSSASSSPSTRPIFTFPALSANAKFTFTILSRPENPLTFPPQAPPPPRLSKRHRPVADVDGEHSCLHKKKRRLRLFLITSRLSPQFSHPATNIVDRGNSKIAVWAKQRALGRNILRKAAILNRIRRQSICALETAGGLGRVLVEQEKEQEQLQLARLTLMYGSHDSATRPLSKDVVDLPEVVETRTGEQIRSSGSSPASSTGSPSPPLHPRDEGSAGEYRSPNEAYAYSHTFLNKPRPSHLPLPPSPLGLSNYDALDLEDDIPDPYAHLDEEYEAEEQDEHSFDDAFPRRSGEVPGFPSQPTYNDFSILDPDEPVIGDYDQVEEGAETVWPNAPHMHGGDTNVDPLPSPSPSLHELFSTASTTAGAVSPNFAPTLSPTSSSPNFPTLYATSTGEQQRTSRRHAAEIEQERQRQRHLMFMSFGS